MKKTTVIFLLFISLSFDIVAWCETPGYDFSRTRLFPGFDGKVCKHSPSVATDWNGTVFLSYSNLLLTGSDVFCGNTIAKSTDGCQTWTKPHKCKSVRDQQEEEIRITFNLSPRYSRFHHKWYALGNETKYIDDKMPFQKVVDGKAWRHPYYADFDIRKGEYRNVRVLPFPYDYAGATLFGEPFELENGDVILTFYYLPINEKSKKFSIVTVKYRFSDDGLEIVEAGNPITEKKLRRGMSEPSLTCFKGKYYLTVRSDERGMFCVSDDGLNFGPLKTWCWEDGTPIGNKNTQQHWINLGDQLYLTYTRESAANAHVFRNRAPVYSALFDTDNGVLVRETEFPLVPELGARLGNFHTINSGDGRSYLVTAEWMQPIGCEKYGSDNSIWLIRIQKK